MPEGQRVIDRIQEANATHNTELPHVEIERRCDAEQRKNLSYCCESEDAESTVKEDLVCEFPVVSRVILYAFIAIDVVVVGAAEEEDLQADFRHVHDSDTQKDELNKDLHIVHVYLKLFT